MSDVSPKTQLYRYCPSVLRRVWDQLQASEVAYRLARGTFWVLLGMIVSRGLFLLSSILAARILGIQPFGELGIVRNTMEMLGVLAGLGLGVTTTKYVAEYRSACPRRAGHLIAIANLTACGMGGLLAIILVVTAPSLADAFLNAPDLAGPLRAAAPLLVLNALAGAQTGSLAGFEAFRQIARVNLWAGLASGLLLPVGAALGGVGGAIGGLTAAALLQCLLNRAALAATAAQSGVAITLRDSWRELYVLSKFSLPATLSSVLVAPVTWLCGSLLVQCPGGYREFAVFTAANQWFLVLTYVPAAVLAAILPILSSGSLRHDAQRLGRFLRGAVAANAAIVVPAAMAGAALSPQIMQSYGPEFSLEGPTLVSVLMTAAVAALLQPVAQLIAATGRMWLGLAMNLGWALLFLLGTHLLLPWGGYGLAVARLAAYLVHSLWVLGFAVWYVKGLSKSTSAVPGPVELPQAA